MTGDDDRRKLCHQYSLSKENMLDSPITYISTIIKGALHSSNEIGWYTNLDFPLGPFQTERIEISTVWRKKTANWQRYVGSRHTFYPHRFQVPDSSLLVVWLFVFLDNIIMILVLLLFRRAKSSEAAKHVPTHAAFASRRAAPRTGGTKRRTSTRVRLIGNGAVVACAAKGRCGTDKANLFGRGGVLLWWWWWMAVHCDC